MKEIVIEMQNISKKIKAIIFDMDGTIIQSNNNWENVIVETIKNFLPEATEKISRNEMLKFQKKLLGVDIVTCAEILKKDFCLNQATKEEILEKILYFESIFINEISIIDGFLEFHKVLRDHGVKSSIATNSHKKYFTRMSENFKFKDLFGEHLYCVDDVNFIPKPQPDLFLHAAKKMEVHPSECIVFEDTRTGFLAAQKANMKCIAIINENNIFSHDLVHGKIQNYHDAISELQKILST